MFYNNILLQFRCVFCHLRFTIILVDDKLSASASSCALWWSQFGDRLKAWVSESSCPRGLRSGTNTGSSVVGLESTKAGKAIRDRLLQPWDGTRRRSLQLGDGTPWSSLQIGEITPNRSLQAGDVHGGVVGVWVRWAQGTGFGGRTGCDFRADLSKVGHRPSSFITEDGDEKVLHSRLEGDEEDILCTDSENRKQILHTLE